MSEPKFKVGDLVRCTNPTHTDSNPFVIYALGNLYTPEGKQNSYYQRKPSFMCHSSGYIGCLESDLEPVPPKEGKA